MEALGQYSAWRVELRAVV